MLMTSFELENKGHACHFAAGVWLSNLCHGFSNPWDTFSWVSRKTARSLENRGIKVRKNGGRVQRKASAFVLCHGRPGFSFYQALGIFSKKREKVV